MAFQNIARNNFVPANIRGQASIDIPLPIGHGQTISQPYTVRQMLKWLDVRTGHKVLDVGSGSGWTTALLSYLVGSKNKVFAVERVPELLTFGRDNCNKIGIKNVQFFLAKKTYGLPEHAEFDRILVSAAADELPDALLKQLNTGGKMVIPVKNDILEITKNSGNEYIINKHPGFIFVPLVSGTA